jgi:hypothetical protein
VHNTEGMWRSGCTAPLIHSLGTKWGEWLACSLMLRPLYSSEKNLGYPLNRRLGGPQKRSGWFEEKKSSLVLSGHWCLSVTVTDIFLRFIPESVRWLLARQKNSRAGKIVKRAAKVNGVILSDRLLSGLEGAKTEHREVSLCVECCWNWDMQRGHRR